MHLNSTCPVEKSEAALNYTILAERLKETGPTIFPLHTAEQVEGLYVTVS